MNTLNLFIILSLFVGVCLNFSHHQKLRKFHLKYKKLNPPRFSKHFIDHGDRHELNPKVFNYKSHNGMFEMEGNDPFLNQDQKEIMDLKQFFQSHKTNCNLSDEEEAEKLKQDDKPKIKDDTYDYFDEPKDPHCFLPKFDEKAALRKWILNKISHCDNSDIEEWEYNISKQSSSSSSSSNDSSSSDDESTPIQNYGKFEFIEIFKDSSDEDEETSSDNSMELFIGQDPTLENELQIVVKSESFEKQEQLIKVLQDGEKASNQKPHRQQPCSKELNDAEHYWFQQKQVPLQECFIENLTMTAFEDIFSESSDALAYVKKLADTHFKQFEKTLKISVTGHSFGASVATLIAQRVLKQCQTWNENEFNRPICELNDVYLFGSPRVGSAGFVELFNTQMTVANVNVYRITNNYDQFIRLPYFKDGYRHVGQQVFYETEEHQPKFCGEYSIMNDAKEHIGRGQGELDNHCNWDEEISEPDLINPKFEISFKKDYANVHNNYFGYRNECVHKSNK